ncbi:MAG: glycosyl hydrolase [Polyangiales bacterium]
MLSAALWCLAACEARDARGAAVSAAGVQVSNDARFELTQFSEPAREFAPGLRWLWPGGAVEDETLARELARIATANYGRVEIQPIVHALGAAETSDARIRTVGTPSYLAHVRAAARAAAAQGLSYDLTLGSAWPSGGPDVPPQAAEQQLLWTRFDVTGPALIDVAIPSPVEPAWSKAANELLPNIRITGPFDRQNLALEAVVAAPLLAADADPPVLGAPRDVTQHVSDGRLRWDVPAGPHVLLAMHRNGTSHIVLKGAYPGAETAALTVDHLSVEGVRWLVEHQLRPWLDALGDDRPQALFVDSFELTGELPWSRDLATSYRDRIGHSPFVEVPFVLRSGGESKYTDIARESSPPVFEAGDTLSALQAREDYEAVRSDAFRGGFIQPLTAEAHTLGVQLRVQAHGGWGSVLDDYAVVDVPEAESLYAGGSFDFLTLAASAAHVAGKRTVTSETFVTLNLDVQTGVFGLDDLWRMLGLAYSAGINRPMHGSLAYPYVQPDGSRWIPFDGDPSTPGGFTTDIRPEAPAWAFLPALNRAQARIDYALSRGESRRDLAWLLLDREQRDFAHLTLGNLNPHAAESESSAALRRAGYTYDRVSPLQLKAAHVASDGSLRIGAASYRGLVIDHAQVIDDAVFELVALAAEGGLPVVWVGESPERVPGTLYARERSEQLQVRWRDTRELLLRVGDMAEGAERLRAEGALPEIEAGSPLAQIGVTLRVVEGGVIVWLFNESALQQSFDLTVHVPVNRAWTLDPETGASTELSFNAAPSSARARLSLPAARGRIIWLTQ